MADGGEVAREKVGWDRILKTIEVGVVVAGAVLSVLSYNSSRVQEAAARELEAAKPFLEMRQKLYLEAVQVAGVLANTENKSDEAYQKAEKRFRQLYVAELSLVEARGVEQEMKRLAKEVAPDLLTMNEKQKAAYNLAHRLRDSFVKSWGIKDQVVDNPD